MILFIQFHIIFGIQKKGKIRNQAFFVRVRHLVTQVILESPDVQFVTVTKLSHFYQIMLRTLPVVKYS